jgi:hypothetical protein
MQDLLVASIEFITVAFAFIVTLDFVTGLMSLWRTCSTRVEPEVIAAPTPALLPSGLEVPNQPNRRFLEGEERLHYTTDNLIDHSTGQKASPLPLNGIGDLATMPNTELRKLCQNAGIKWRNAHGTHKHLTKLQMISALTA